MTTRCSRSSIRYISDSNCNLKIELSKLKKGEKAFVTSIECENGELLGKLVSMGVVKGAEVVIDKIAPLGDPIGIKVRGSRLCLRKNEAQKVIVKRELVEKVVVDKVIVKID